ncbi:MAG: hypothetical protein QXP88_00740 [Thermoproteota archaeon]
MAKEKQTLEKAKENLLLNLDEENFTKEMRFGGLTLVVQAPSILEEAKISIKKYDILRKLYYIDKDIKEYLEAFTINDLKLNEEGKLETEKVAFDVNNNQHLEFVFNNLNSNLQDLVLRLAYLSVVTKQIKRENEFLDVSFVDLIQRPLGKQKLSELNELVNSIVDWVNSLEVDPFLLKN